MAAIAWTPTLAALDAELATATGPTKQIGQEIRADLYRMGQEYDQRFTVQVSAAKDAFAALVTAAHEEADRTCRYAESLVGTAGPALTVDIYSNAAILTRCTAAIKASTSDILKRTLQANNSRVSSVYAKGGVDEGTTGRYMIWRGTEAYPGDRTYERTVRALELQILQQISDASEWIALAQYS